MKKRYGRITGFLLLMVLLFCAVPVGTVRAQEGDDYYGRQELAKLPNSEALLHVYDLLVECVDKSVERKFFDSDSYPVSMSEMELIVEAYLCDHPEHFWVDFVSYYTNANQKVVAVVPVYVMSGSELEQAKAAFWERVEVALKGIKSNMSQYERALYLHDWIVENVEYDGCPNQQNAYGAMVEGKAVCEGYSKAYQYLLQKVGIPSYMILGTSLAADSHGLAHAWNLMQIDGQYYQTDVTWDDGVDRIYYGYLNLTTDKMAEDHAITSRIPILECTAAEANYFQHQGHVITVYDVEAISAILKEDCGESRFYIPGDVDEFTEWLAENCSEMAAQMGLGYYRFTYGRRGREFFVQLYDPTITDKPGKKPTETPGENPGDNPADIPADGEYTLIVDEEGNWHCAVNGAVDHSAGFRLVPYGGETFVTANGIMIKDVSGLFQVDDVWYYLAEGRIVTEYEGLALYDGSWFMVKDGRLNVQVKGIVDYDGGKFLVSDGRLRPDCDGLFMNTDGKWYFLAKGQVQTQYTGLAFYDGEWFYVVNGILASDYVGNVQYDGEWFYVVNGMLMETEN